MVERAGQVAEEACRRRPGLPVLYASGYIENAIAHDRIVDPGIRFLPKPFTGTTLPAKVRAALDAA